MARKRVSYPDNHEPAELVVSRNDAEKKIDDRIAIGEELMARPILSWDQLKATKNDFYTWSEYNAELMQRLFTTASIANEYADQVAFASVGGRRELGREVRSFRGDVDRKLRRLKSVRERLELMEMKATPQAEVVRVVEEPATREKGKVFVVHGHDEAVRESTARFLDGLGFEPIILHEQESGGRTLVEKLEHYSNVDYAVVLLTPDDVGAKAGSEDDLKPRARQNVILELGYFVGKLGRGNVCVLHKGDLDLPSDYLGVVYVPYDSGGAWRVLFAKEMKAAGFSIDLNKAM